MLLRIFHFGGKGALFYPYERLMDEADFVERKVSLCLQVCDMLQADCGTGFHLSLRGNAKDFHRNSE